MSMFSNYDFYDEEEFSNSMMEWEAREYGFDDLEDYLETNFNFE